MISEYGFSKATRGKLFRPGAVLVPPIHIEPEIKARLAAEARLRGVTLRASTSTTYYGNGPTHSAGEATNPPVEKSEKLVSA